MVQAAAAAQSRSRQAAHCTHPSPDARAPEVWRGYRPVQRTSDIADRAQQPQADSGIVRRVVADLLERRVQNAVDADPRDEHPRHMRRIKQHRRRRHAAQPADQDAAQMINTTDRRAGIIDRRRDRPQRDIDDLDDAELHVLLQRTGRPDVEGAQ